MNRMLIFIILIIVITPGLLIFTGMIFTDSQSRSELKELDSHSIEHSGELYHSSQLEGLPEPVQRYFEFALKEGQPYVSSVELTHDGRFKTALDKEWIDIKGEQYFSADEPGFLWMGKTSLFSVRDMYIAGKGRIVITLFSTIKIQEGTGAEYDQGELLRWLGESVWFPTNLLPGPYLEWAPIDANSALLKFDYKGLSVKYKVIFNETGRIVQLETRRYMGDEGLQSWVGRVSDYREINNMMIPCKIEAFWMLDGREHAYADFDIQEIHYEF